MINKTILQLSINAFILLIIFTSCKGQPNNAKNNVVKQSTNQNETQVFGFLAKKTDDFGKDIRYVFQDKNDNYWFAAYGEGVYYYDGKTLAHFTDKDGLCSNFVSDIQEDATGVLWFNTSDGICNFDGKKFTNYSDTIKNVSKESLEFTKNDLFFCYNGNAYRY